MVIVYVRRLVQEAANILQTSASDRLATAIRASGEAPIPLDGRANTKLPVAKGRQVLTSRPDSPFAPRQIANEEGARRSKRPVRLAGSEIGQRIELSALANQLLCKSVTGGAGDVGSAAGDPFDVEAADLLRRMEEFPRKLFSQVSCPVIQDHITPRIESGVFPARTCLLEFLPYVAGGLFFDLLAVVRSRRITRERG